MDRYGYTAPARVKLLVVPVNSTLEEEFSRYTNQLLQCVDIYLADILALGPFQYFNPQSNPSGRVMFDMTMVAAESELLFLHDFEPFRKTFVVLGVGKYSNDNVSTLDTLKKKYPSIPVHNLVIFDGPDMKHQPLIFYHPQNSPITTCEAIMGEVAGNFLRALDSYALSFANITLRSPVLIKDNNKLTRTISHAQKRQSSSSFKFNGLSATSDSPSSKLTAKHNGRQAKLMGNFYLLAGRYLDALALFTDLLSHLKKCDDFLWLGSALEGIGIACVLLLYVGQSYHLNKTVICSVLHISHKRFPSVLGVLGPLSPSTDHPQLLMLPRVSQLAALLRAPLPRASMSSVTSFNDLQLMALPEIVKLVLNRAVHYYHVSMNDHENIVPDVVYVDLILRTIKFMLAVYLGGNDVTPEVLAAVVTLTNLNTPHPRLGHGYFTRGDILSHIERVFSLSIVDINLIDQCRIYSVLALMYTDLGLMRKRALILRILLNRIVPQLEQGRAGAEQHSIYAKVNQLAASVHEIFQLLFKVYQIPIDGAGSPGYVNSSTSLQIPLLKLGLRIAEATWDDEFSIKLCNLLLSKFTHCLGVDDQTSIKEKVALVVAKTPLLAQGYWDPFLVRSMLIVASSDDIAPVALVNRQGLMGQLATKTAQVAEPFFDPYSKKPGKPKCPVLIKNESYTVRVELQNPFAFPIDIREVALVTEPENHVVTVGLAVRVAPPPTAVGLKMRNGMPFTKPRLASLLLVTSDELAQSTAQPSPVVGPKSTETFEITFRPDAVGAATITAVDIRVGECKRHRFKIGIPKTCELLVKLGNLAPVDAEGAIFDINVIPPQPKLSLSKVLLVNGLIMLMEGERHRFDIHLTNYSNEVVNYLSFSFWDSTIEPLTARLDQLGTTLPANEVYELEWALVKNNPFRIVNKEAIVALYQTIDEGGGINVQVELFGKKNMKKAKIILEYGHKHGEHDDFLVVRHVLVPINVSVVGSVEIFNCDVLPFFSGAFTHYGGDSDQLKHLKRFVDTHADADPNLYCVVVIDVANILGERITAELGYDKVSGEVVLEPTKLTRFMFPIKRLDLEVNTRATIPSLRQKQFIKNYLMTDEEDQRMRGIFWIRNYMLEHLWGKWRAGNDRHGVIDTRVIRLTQRMADLLMKSPVSITLDVLDGETNEPIARNKSQEYPLETDKFYLVRATMVNRTENTIHGIFRHTPQDAVNSNKPIDRRILINGVVQQPLGPEGIAGGSTKTVDLGCLFLERGEYHWHLVLDMVEIGRMVGPAIVMVANK